MEYWPSARWKIGVCAGAGYQWVEPLEPFVLIGAHECCGIRITDKRVPPVAYIACCFEDSVEVWPVCPIAFPRWGVVEPQHELMIGRQRVCVVHQSRPEWKTLTRKEAPSPPLAKAPPYPSLPDIILQWKRKSLRKTLHRRVTILGEDHPSTLRMYGQEMRRCDHGVIAYGETVWLIDLNPTRLAPPDQLVTRVEQDRGYSSIASVLLSVTAPQSQQALTDKATASDPPEKPVAAVPNVSSTLNAPSIPHVPTAASSGNVAANVDDATTSEATATTSAKAAEPVAESGQDDTHGNAGGTGKRRLFGNLDPHAPVPSSPVNGHSVNGSRGGRSNGSVQGTGPGVAARTPNGGAAAVSSSAASLPAGSSVSLPLSSATADERAHATGLGVFRPEDSPDGAADVADFLAVPEESDSTSADAVDRARPPSDSQVSGAEAEVMTSRLTERLVTIDQTRFIKRRIVMQSACTAAFIVAAATLAWLVFVKVLPAISEINGN